MDNNNKNEFSSKYILDYKTYKEFSAGYIATRKSNIILLFIFLAILLINFFYRNYSTIIGVGIVFVLVVLIVIITGRNKLQYKRYKSLNNNEDLEENIKINKEKIISLSGKGNTASYDFEQIIGIIETKNLLILKLKYNMGIILDKRNLIGGTKEELIDYLFSVCKNLKKKKVTKAKVWLILRRVILILFALIFILSIVLFALNNKQIDTYKNLLEQNGYEIEMKESVYNGHDTKRLTIHKNNEYTWSYMYEFGTDKDAKRNLEYWANLQTDNNIKDEYRVEESRNYQKYAIDDGQYIILIRKDNVVFYGIGHSQHKDELDNILKIIEK